MPFSCQHSGCDFTFESNFKFCPTCGTRQLETTGEFVESVQSKQEKRVLGQLDLKPPKVLFFGTLFAGLLLVVPITLIATSEGAGVTSDSSLEPETEYFAPVGYLQTSANAWKGNEDNNFQGRHEPGSPCLTLGNQNPLANLSGTEVTLRDSSGSVVGLTELEPGRHQYGWRISASNVFSDDTFKADYCLFYFRFDKIESDDDFFSIEIGRRAENSYTRGELRKVVVLKLDD